MAFHPDSQLLASAGGDGSVRLWEVNKELLIATLLGHTAAVTSVKFNLSFDALASSGLDGRVIIWKINNEK